MGCSRAGRRSGRCGSATRPGRSSRRGWPAPTRCRPRTRWTPCSARPSMPDRAALTDTRVRRPQAIAQAAAARRRPASVLGKNGRAMVIAADHTARGMLGAGRRADAMVDRGDLLDRLCLALSRPGVTGVLGTPDVVEDLLLLGALDGKAVVGSMNRGGLAGTVFEIDDRFTGYDAEAIAESGFEGGKMLTRIDPADPARAPPLGAWGGAVSALARRGLLAMVEPFLSHRVDGRVRNELTAEAMIRAMSVASGL